MRTTFDAEHDILQGLTVEQAEAEAARLTAKANELTTYLARPRAGLTSQVRLNLEAERDRYEWDASAILARLAEHEGKILRVREAGPAPSARADGVRRRKLVAS